MKFGKKKWKVLSAGLVLSAALSFLLTVYAPLELFMGSQSDFWFTHKQLGLSAGILFGILTLLGCLCFFLLRLWGRTPYAVGLGVGFALLLAAYIQGTFLTGALPAMDGTEVDWNSQPLQRWISIGLIVGCLALCLLMTLKKRKLFRRIVLWGSAGLTAMLAITLFTLLLTTPITEKENRLVPTGYKDMEYSTDTNLIVLIIDAVDSNALQAELEKDPEAREALKDFTYFEDALAGYPFTRNSLPLMLTGQWFENETDFDSYVNDAFAASPLMHKLTQENYRIGLYNTGELYFDAENYAGVFENQLDLSPRFTSLRASFKLIGKMAAVRYAPWDLKYLGYDVMDYAPAIRLLPTNEYGEVKKKNTDFYAALCKEDALTLTTDKCARILHIEGGHVPFQYNKEVQVVEEGSYAGNLQATLTICRTLIRRLKESGVYDNSAIVILADHGFAEGADDFPPRMHPALMIKGIGETGEQMQTDDTPLSYEQLSAAFAALLDKTPAADLFPENAYPDGRRFIGYWYLSEHAMAEYHATGKADETHLMTTTGTRYLTEKK